MASKYGKVEEVIEAFSSGKEKPYINKGGSVFHEDGVLFSCRTPIAVLGDSHRPSIINGDRYSPTTDQHVSSAFQFLNAGGKDIFTTSFSALARFIEHATGRPSASERDVATFLQRDKLVVLDHEGDFSAYYTKNGTWEALKGSALYGGVERKTISLPAGVTIQYDALGNPVRAHRAATALFHCSGETAVAGFDENQFFLSILPTNPRTLEGAYADLKPEDVHLAERDSLPVYRQGEWFFIPHLDGPEALEEYNKMPGTEYLLRGQNGGNPHITTRGQHISGSRHLVSGRIRHPEHRVLRLSYRDAPEIYLAVENTAVASFSAFGRVD